MPLREARIPRDSKVARIIRGDRMILPRGDQTIDVGDRIVIIGSPEAARDLGRHAVRGQAAASTTSSSSARAEPAARCARALVDQGLRVRIIEADAKRAQLTAEQFPTVRVYHATGFDPEFLDRERIGQSRAAVFVMQDDAKNHYAATLAKLHGVSFTIAIVHEAASTEVFERAGIDVAINPRQVTAEEIVRFAHDPRTRQVTMLEGDRFEILDVTVRPESEYARPAVPHDADARRADRRDRARRAGDLPARRRRAARRRPRDHLHGVGAGDAGREGALTLLWPG